MNLRSNSIVLLLSFVGLAISAQAQWFSWESRTDLNFDGMLNVGAEMAQRGFAPLKIESTIEDGSVRYAATWVKEDELSKEQRELAIRMNRDGFNEKVESMKNRGYVPVDIAVAPVAGEPEFSAIFSKNAFQTWRSRHGISALDVFTLTQEFKRSGMQLVDVNAYPTPTGMQYAALWGDAGWDDQIIAIGLPKDAFQERAVSLPAGYVPANMNVASVADTTAYSGIFVKDDEFLYDFRYDLNEQELKAYSDRHANAGYRPLTVAGYNLRLERRYAAIFVKKRPVEVRSNPIFTPQTFNLPTAVGRTLDIAPVRQQTQVWCWLAIGEMVFRHYGLRNNNPGGNFQCGIIGTIMSDTECNANCFNTRCIRPSGSNYATVRMLKDYAWMSSKKVLRADEGYELPFAAIKANIDRGRPIIAGVSPTRRQYYDGAEHVALITGYEMGPGGVDLIINDPFPYPPMGNPYTRNNARAISNYQYRMPMQNFTRDLFWHWSISNISIQ
jgi:hypothetical protein